MFVDYLYFGGLLFVDDFVVLVDGELFGDCGGNGWFYFFDGGQLVGGCCGDGVKVVEFGGQGVGCCWFDMVDGQCYQYLLQWCCFGFVEVDQQLFVVG